ncbi:calcium-binding protein, partial [Inquilinus sp.]|uniref:calcium-binding protein n=1 Tax=Inquilinus sp. TaxID=1932117 RepID=UPI0031D708DF
VIHILGDGVVIPPGYTDIPQATALGDTLNGLGGNDIIYGGGGIDLIDGGIGDDRLVGGLGDDILTGGAGGDRFEGGAGIDTVSYAGAIAAVVANLLSGVGSGGNNDSTGDSFVDMENIIGGAGGDTLIGNNIAANVLTGNAGDDDLEGLGGNDTLLGGAGDDRLTGGTGADQLDGGAGIDTIYYTGSSAVTVDLSTGTASGGDAAGDVFSSIENVYGAFVADDVLTGSAGNNILGGQSGNDILTGSAGNNILGGQSGNDILNGLGGADTLLGSYDDDTLNGGDGNDVLYGESGADHLDGGAGIDTASYYNRPEAVVVDLAAGTGSGGEAEGDTLTGIENVSGSQGSDTLSGDAGANALQGWNGNDVLRGRGGADHLDGGAGTDLASYWGEATAVTVNLATGTGSGGNAAGDTYVSIENVNGSKAGDTLIGSGGANALNGYEGNDVIQGGAGKDTLTGGIGADRFVYAATGDSVVGANADRITDFSHAQGDRIDLSAIDANTGAAGDQAFAFIGSGLFTGVAGQLRFTQGGGVTTVAGDVNGDGAADFHIQLTGTIALVAADFVL